MSKIRSREVVVKTGHGNDNRLPDRDDLMSQAWTAGSTTSRNTLRPGSLNLLLTNRILDLVIAWSGQIVPLQTPADRLVGGYKDISRKIAHAVSMGL